MGRQDPLQDLLAQSRNQHQLALAVGMSMTALSHRTLPRSIGWLGAFAAMILLTPFWGIGLMGVLLWMATTSVALTARELRTTED